MILRSFWLILPNFYFRKADWTPGFNIFLKFWKNLIFKLFGDWMTFILLDHKSCFTYDDLQQYWNSKVPKYYDQDRSLEMNLWS